MQIILWSIKAGKLKMVLFLVIIALGTVELMPQASNAGISNGTYNDFSSVRARNIEKILAFIDNKKVSEKLHDFGIDPASVKNGIRQLSDEEISGVAARLERIEWDDDSDDLPGLYSDEEVITNAIILAAAVFIVVIVLTMIYEAKMKKLKSEESEEKEKPNKIESGAAPTTI